MQKIYFPSPMTLTHATEQGIGRLTALRTCKYKPCYQTVNSWPQLLPLKSCGRAG